MTNRRAIITAVDAPNATELHPSVGAHGDLTAPRPITRPIAVIHIACTESQDVVAIPAEVTPEAAAEAMAAGGAAALEW